MRRLRAFATRRNIVPVAALLGIGLTLLIVYNLYVNQPIPNRLFDDCIIDFAVQCWNDEGTMVVMSYQEYLSTKTGVPQTQTAEVECDTRLTATPPPDAIIVLIIRAKTVYLRAGPHQSYQLLGTAHCGERFAVIAQANVGQGTWYLIMNHDGEPVWIQAIRNELIPADAQIPIAATTPPTP
jgi:hypothetical protein